MRGLPSILSLFCNKFNKFNTTRARTLDSVYHNDMTFLKIVNFEISFLPLKPYNFVIMYRNVRKIVMDVTVITFPVNL